MSIFILRRRARSRPRNGRRLLVGAVGALAVVAALTAVQPAAARESLRYELPVPPTPSRSVSFQVAGQRHTFWVPGISNIELRIWWELPVKQPPPTVTVGTVPGCPWYADINLRVHLRFAVRAGEYEWWSRERYAAKITAQLSWDETYGESTNRTGHREDIWIPQTQYTSSLYVTRTIEVCSTAW